jgi:hypothetical protein
MRGEGGSGPTQGVGPQTQRVGPGFSGGCQTQWVGLDPLDPPQGPSPSLIVIISSVGCVLPATRCCDIGMSTAGVPAHRFREHPHNIVLEINRFLHRL